jgi:hypothetical protein
MNFEALCFLAPLGPGLLGGLAGCFARALRGSVSSSLAGQTSASRRRVYDRRV